MFNDTNVVKTFLREQKPHSFFYTNGELMASVPSIKPIVRISGPKARQRNIEMQTKGEKKSSILAITLAIKEMLLFQNFVVTTNEKTYPVHENS